MNNQDIETMIRTVIREELAAAKVDRYRSVDELIERLALPNCSGVYIELTKPKGSLLAGHVEKMHDFLVDLRAALNVERSSR